MSKILAVRVDNQLIELLPPSAQCYGNLFDIDSLSLLLGTNGAGKTRILIALANAVASTQDDSFQFYFEGTKNGDYEPVSPYSKQLCAIYYSALPYKRQLNRRKGIINASPKIKGSTYDKRLDEFDMVAKTLDIKTELVGVISYSKLAFRSILIPVIKEKKDLLRSSKLGHLIEELEHMAPANTSYEVNDYLLKDRNREILLNDIEYYLKGVINEMMGSDDSFYMLSSLEYIYAKQGKKLAIHAALSLLIDIGIIKNKLDSSDKLIHSHLLSIARDTRLLVGSYVPNIKINKDTRNIEFPIKNKIFSEQIKSIDTPIKIEWSNQSSGLQALVEQFSLINEAVEKAVDNSYQSILLLIDEGDAYLHLDWQRKYISILNKFLGKLKKRHYISNFQLIIATHSPLLAADIPGDFVTSLDSKNFSSTFAAPIEDVIANAFSSNSLGEFAAKNINEIYSRAISGNITEHDRSLTDAIGDIAIQNTLKRSFNNDN